jgi:hypothetical protein
MRTDPPTARPTTKRRPRAAARLAVVSVMAGAGLVAAGTTQAVNSTEADVMQWLDDTDPSIIIDQSNTCHTSGIPERVAYRGDQLIVRSNLALGAIETRVNNAFDALYPGGLVDYVDTPAMYKITWPTPPGYAATVPVVVVPLLARQGGGNHDIVGVSRRMREQYSVKTSPSYAYTPSGPYTHYWPNGHPEWTAEASRDRTTTVPGKPALVGTGVTIWVADTGVVSTSTGALANLSMLDPAIDDEQPNLVLNENDPIFADHPAAGHLTGVSSTIDVSAPGSTIVGLRVNQRNGVLTDSDAAGRIAEALWLNAPNNLPPMLVLAFGTAICDGLVPLGTETVAEMVDKYNTGQARGMLIVASAGNIASTRPHYPAAFTNVLSVGAIDATLDADGSAWTVAAKTAPVADFSNTGPWVKVYAPGVELAVDHLNGIRFQTGERELEGAATVSGTSFSAPNVAGYLAEQMSRFPTSKVRSLLTSLLNTARAPMPKCGTNRAITGKVLTLGTYDGRITDAAVGNGPTC